MFMNDALMFMNDCCGIHYFTSREICVVYEPTIH